MLRITLFLLAMLRVIDVHAQPLRFTFERIGAEQGLGHGAVYGITQDTLGLIWFATEDGLLYFDGRQIHDYQAHRIDHPKVINISQLMTSQSGEIWAGYWGKGLLKVDPHFQTHVQYQTNPEVPNSIPSNSPQCFHEDGEGGIWIGFYGGGLGKFQPATGDFKVYAHDDQDQNSLIHNHVWGITSNFRSDPHGIWIGTYGGLDRLDTRSGEIRHFPQIFPDVSHNNRIRTVYLDDQGTLWIGTRYQGLILMDISTGEVRQHPSIPERLNSVGINTIHEDRMGNMWIGSKSDGLWVINSNDNSIELYSFEPRNPRSISFNDIRHIYEDNGGIIWIATRGGGVNRVNPYDKFFGFWTDEENPDPNGRVVTAIHQQIHGKLLVGSKGGLVQLDKDLNVLNRFSARSAPALSEDEVTSIEADGLNRYWIGTDDGLDLLDLSANTITPYKRDFNNPESLSDNSIRALLKTDEDHLWVGTYRGGLNVYDYNSKTFRHFDIPADQNGAASDNNVLALMHAPNLGKDNLWVGTSQGLLIFDMESHTWDRQHRSLPLPYGDPVRCILAPGRGIVIVGQNSRGVVLIDTQKDEIRRYTDKDGLSANTIQGILQDDLGNLWVTTTYGLCEFIPIENRFRVYDQLDGIQGNVFSPGAVFKNSQGNLFAGGMNGLTFFDPRQRTFNKHVPPMVITSFSINNEEIPIVAQGFEQEDYEGLVLRAPIAAMDELVLDSDVQFITFEFAALDYSNPKQNKYAVMLEGFQADWTYLGSEKRMTFTHLPPGTYNFKIKGSNDDGVWNETGSSIRLILKPAFYQTTWFKILILVLLVSFIYLGLILRLRATRKRNKELGLLVKQQTQTLTLTNQELEDKNQSLAEALQAKNKFFSIISHDLRGPLGTIMQSLQTFVEMFNELTREDIHGMITAMEVNATRTFKLMENLLMWSRLQTGTLEARPEKIQLADALQDVLQSQEARAVAKDITMRTTVSNDIVIFADREFLSTIVRNLISNAIKFTPRGGMISVIADRKDGRVMIKVADNGVGIPEAHQADLFRTDSKFHTRGTENEESSGLGLLLVKEFVEASGGQITFMSQEGLGTTFQFTVPTG